MKTRSNLLLVFLLILLLSPSYGAQDLKGKVIGITDGDTITILRDSTPIQVRLSGIDAPESGQAFGERAKQFTSALCFGDEVTFRVLGSGSWGRMAADVVLSDGRILSEELLRAGMAWHFKKYSNSEHLARLEQEAKVKKIGLWSDPNAVPPWEWRGKPQIGAQPLTTPVALGTSQIAPATQQSQTVYITNSGTKYHRDGCRFLSKSRNPIALADAIAKGYGPCSTCQPPTAEQATSAQQATSSNTPRSSSVATNDGGDQIVYVTKTGTKYHKAGCRFLSKSAMPMKLSDAALRYSPCSVCKPPTPKRCP